VHWSSIRQRWSKPNSRLSTTSWSCTPAPQSYYDWLAAGGGYYDGYAPPYQGRFLNECRLRDTDHPRACRGDSGRVGSDGLGAGGVAAFGHPLALSSPGHVSGTTSGGG